MHKSIKVLTFFLCILCIVIAILSVIVWNYRRNIKKMIRNNGFVFDLDLTEEDLMSEIKDLNVVSRKRIPFTSIKQDCSRTLRHWAIICKLSTGKTVLVTDDNNIVLSVRNFEFDNDEHEIICNCGIMPGVKLMDFLMEFQHERKTFRYNVFNTNCQYLVLRMCKKFGGNTNLKHYANIDGVKQIVGELRRKNNINSNDSGLTNITKNDLFKTGNWSNEIEEEKHDFEQVMNPDNLIQKPEFVTKLEKWFT